MSEPNPNARPPQAFDLAFITGLEDVTEVLLIRHGQQAFNFGGPVGEAVDPPLSERGLMQADALGQWLSTRPIAAIYASQLRRAFQTAAAVAKGQGRPPESITIVEDLREVEVFRDIPQDKTAMEYFGPDLLAGMRRRMMVEKSWDVYPASESSLEFRRRAINAVEAVIARHPGERVAVVCHGGVINAYIGHIIGSKYDMFFRPAHTSVSVVAAAEDRRALHALNDLRHLETPEGDLRSY
ncbi:MAG TPA: histidine phosphatase family protein [Dehalococcoidia bacterium]|nr:histidine phosphatase family protein [Dehalococcoidia bacterium]